MQPNVLAVVFFYFTEKAKGIKYLIPSLDKHPGIHPVVTKCGNLTSR